MPSTWWMSVLKLSGMTGIVELASRYPELGRHCGQYVVHRRAAYLISRLTSSASPPLYTAHISAFRRSGSKLFGSAPAQMRYAQT